VVAFASKHGSTGEIADAIAQELQRHGLDVDCRAAADVGTLDGYDAVILGSAVYMKRRLGDAKHLFRKHRRELSARPFWIFSSGPFGAEPDPAWSERPRIVKEAERMGVRDHVVLGGRLPLEPSGFIEKAMVRETPPDVADLRDWDEIRRWAARAATELRDEVAV
jgi:menaquinone-dependent protoporphyrinogen oxidase